MNVAVCVKQIPDPAVPGSLDADHTLNRDGKLILDESDSYGVEMALQLLAIFLINRRNPLVLLRFGKVQLGLLCDCRIFLSEPLSKSLLRE